MVILVISPRRDLSFFTKQLAELVAPFTVRLWRPGMELTEAQVAVVWQPPSAIWKQMPNLAFVQSYGAGVESLLADPALPSLPLCRMVEPALTAAMSRYLVGVVLADQLRLDQLAVAQQQRQWSAGEPRSGRRVVILGCGSMGLAAGQRLADLGFTVRWWRASAPENPQQLAGEEALHQAVGESDYLLNTLPLTATTHGLLDSRLWQSAKGLMVVNVGRGGHLNEADLLAALDKGQLRRAVLDVFDHEPLPADHPFWHHPAITVTPHCSALTDPLGAAQVVADNVRRWQRGLPLMHLVDRQRGY